MIAQGVPCSAAHIEAELAEQGLTAIGMSIEGVAAGAKLLGRPASFKIVKVQDGKGPPRQAAGEVQPEIADW